MAAELEVFKFVEVKDKEQSEEEMERVKHRIEEESKKKNQVGIGLNIRSEVLLQKEQVHSFQNFASRFAEVNSSSAGFRGLYEDFSFHRE